MLQKTRYFIATIIGNRRSPMAREFLKSEGTAWQPDLTIAHEAFHQQYYFFYGSLMDHSTLARVLRPRYRPELRPAKVVGYRCKLWGQYPALLDGPPGATVCGMAYVVQTPSELKRLKTYKTDHYKSRPYLIKLEDSIEVPGSTFLWNADNAQLREGTFDLKDWQMNKLG